MCRASTGVQPHAQNAARRRAEPVVRRLAVDEEPYASWRELVGGLRPIAATFLAGKKEQRQPRFP